jgi:hypothetical protein
MSITKIDKIIKKYKSQYKRHLDSWEDAQKRMRAKTPKGQIVPHEMHFEESYEYMRKGNQLLANFMKELETQEVFPKQHKTLKTNK